MKKFRPCGQDSECGFVIRSMLGGYESTEEAARALGVYPSLLRHWATIVRSPSPRKFFGRSQCCSMRPYKTC